MTFIFDQFLLNMPLPTGPPTQAKAYKTLLQQELESTSSTMLFGKTLFVNDGLGLARDQCVVYDPSFQTRYSKEYTGRKLLYLFPWAVAEQKPRLSHS